MTFYGLQQGHWIWRTRWHTGNTPPPPPPPGTQYLVVYQDPK